VKSAVSKTFYIDSYGNVLRERFQQFKREFSETGLILSSRSTELNGLDYSHYIFSYDEKFETVIQKFVRDTGLSEMYYIFRLDNKFRTVEKKLIIGESCASREVWFFDDENLTESNVVYGPSGKIEKRIIGNYNSNEKITDLQITGKNGDISIYKMTYIEPNTKITKISDKNKEIKKFISETKDSCGNLLKYSESGPAGVNFFSVTYKNFYNENSLLKELICFENDGKISYRRFFEYDKFKNIVCEKTYKLDKNSENILDKIIETQYEYFE